MGDNTHGLRAKDSGFTLIELLVVLTILGLLATLVGPRVMKFLSGGRSGSARLQVEELASALETYRLEVGHYPSTDEGLKALVEQPPGATRWDGPYLSKKTIPKDPWGYEYHYRRPGEDNRDFDLYSLGRDNADGGEGEDKDILSWE